MASGCGKTPRASQYWGIRSILAAISILSAAATASPQALPNASNAPTRVLLQCTTTCDEDYFRTELTFVDLVRNRQDADVHVLLAADATQANGERITLTFIGQGRFTGRTHVLRQTVIAAETEASIRAETLRLLSLGLVPFLLESPAVDSLAVVSHSRPVAVSQDDPWKRWTFRAAMSGNGSSEQALRTSTYGGSFRANRTTESLKLNLSASGSSTSSSFTLPENRTFEYSNQRFTTSGLLAKSLGSHWSAGVRSVISSATFENLDRSWFITPVIEFDVFPYSEVTRRLLTIQYGAGVRAFDYERETLFGKLTEMTAAHVINVAATARQPWGTISAGVDASSFLPDLHRNRVTGSGDVEFNLARGLSLTMSGEIRSVRDQVYLPKGQATAEEVLVRQRQLPTRYQVYYSIGLAYTFGSIYSPLVNPRMDRGGF